MSNGISKEAARAELRRRAAVELQRRRGSQPDTTVPDLGAMRFDPNVSQPAQSIAVAPDLHKTLDIGSSSLEGLKHGLKSGASGTLGRIANVLQTGGGRFPPQPVAAYGLRKKAGEIAPTEELRGLGPKVIAGLTQFGIDIPQIAALSAGGGPLGLALFEAISQDPTTSTPGDILKAGARGAALGGALKGASYIPSRAGRAATGAGIFGGASAATGERGEDLIASTLIGGALGTAGKPSRFPKTKPLEKLVTGGKPSPTVKLPGQFKAEPTVKKSLTVEPGKVSKGKYKVSEGESFVNAEVVDGGKSLLILSSWTPEKLRRQGVYTKLLKKVISDARKDNPKLEYIEGNAISKEAIATAKKWKTTERLPDKSEAPLFRTKISEITDLTAPRLTPKAKTKLEDAGVVPKEVVPPAPKKVVPKPKPPSTELGAIGTPETVKALGESVSKGIQSVSSLTKEMIDKTKTPPVILRGVKQAKETMIEHDRQIRRAESTNKLFEKTVKDAVVEPKQQMMILHAVEHDMRGPFWDKLLPQEKSIANWAAKEKTKLDQFIRDHEVFDTMDMPPGLRHISHWWKDPKTGEPYKLKFGKFAKTSPLGKKRTIPTFAEGMKATPENPMGEGGLTPASTNIGRIIGESWESVMRAHQSREMFKTLGKIQAETDVTIQRKPGARPGQIRMVEQWDKLVQQGLADNYVRASDMGPNAKTALSKRLPIKTADGKIMLIDKDVGVHENIAPFVRAYIESPTYNNFDRINFATKSLKLGFSMFHVVSLGMQELANRRPPFYNIKRGLGLRTELGKTVRLLHQEGLELHKGYEDLGSRNKFFEGTTKAGRFGNAVTKPIELMRSFIFDVVQPGMKTSFAVDTYNKTLPKYLRRGLSKEVAAREAVQAADGHFSGEHYKRSLLETNRFMAKLYFSPEARKWWQRGILSPTWQREHLIIGKNVAKSFMTDKMIKRLHLAPLGPIKAEYRNYALGAVAMIGAVDMWNLMSTQKMDGKAKHLWENPKGKGFAVRAWWDEPDGSAAYIRPLKSVFELAEGAVDPVKKASYKIAPLLQAIIAQFPNNQYRKYNGVQDMPKRTWDFVTDVSTPIVANQFADWVKDKKTFWSVTAPFFGMPTSKSKDGGKHRGSPTSRSRPTRQP